jgi:lysophospholipase L1-like esterase
MRRLALGILTLSLVAPSLDCARVRPVAPATGIDQSRAATTASDRWEADIRKFEAQDRTSPPAAGGVVFVGSSSIVRWKLADAFPDLGPRAINRGFGGSSMVDVVRYADRIVVPYKPRTVVLYEGDNDLMSTDTPEQVASQFTQFLDRVHRGAPDAKIVAIAVKPSVQRWAKIDKARAINALMQAECERRPYATFVDVEKPMLSADGQPRPELYVEDGLHMSPAGYQIWNQLIASLVR